MYVINLLYTPIILAMCWEFSYELGLTSKTHVLIESIRNISQLDGRKNVMEEEWKKEWGNVCSTMYMTSLWMGYWPCISCYLSSHPDKLDKVHIPLSLLPSPAFWGGRLKMTGLQTFLFAVCRECFTLSSQQGKILTIFQHAIHLCTVLWIFVTKSLHLKVVSPKGKRW